MSHIKITGKISINMIDHPQLVKNRLNKQKSKEAKHPFSSAIVEWKM